MQYKKLTEIEELNVKEAKRKWKLWDNATNKMLSSDTYVQGYKKSWDIKISDDEYTNVSNQNFGDMLAEAYAQKKPVEALKFTVKTNGKTGMDIRYYFNYAGIISDTKEQRPPDDQDIQSEGLPF